VQSILLVGLAGAFGAVSRYGVGLLAQRSLGAHSAVGTLLVNVLGCLLLGFLLELDRNSNVVGPSLRLLLGVGFLGAFTTFSTFGYETIRFLQNGDGQAALLNVAGNLILGLGGVWLGLLAARAWYPAS
jgi:CrcB protein